MKYTRIAIVVASLMLAQTAHAQSQQAAPQLRSSPTRAEVLADLQIWRASGLAAFEGDTSQVWLGSRSLQAARARYEQLRNSSAYGELVQAVAAGDGKGAREQLAAANRGQK